MVDFQYFLNQKYANLREQAAAQRVQADASAVNAKANTTNAATNAITGRAAAGLDTVRTQLLPGESAAAVALQRAQTGLVTEQSRVVAPESVSRIALQGAQGELLGAQAGRENINARGDYLTRVKGYVGQLPTIGGGGTFRLPPETPRRAGESEFDYQNRNNGL